MIFKQHSALSGKHAFLSPSQPAWLNYNEQKIEARFHSWRAAARGTALHSLAHDAIKLGVKLAKGNAALATYVSDALHYGMECEQLLYYSDNCYGTADTISFNRNFLRIHDLKTGINATSMKQLLIYAALFCLEYGVSPYDIRIELRIYQRDEIKTYVPIPEEIIEIMDRIIFADQYIEQLKEARW